MSKYLFFFFASVMCAQTSLTLSTSTPIYPGSALNMVVTLAGSAGQNIAGFEFGLPAGSTSIAVGAASTAATKTAWDAGTTLLLTGLTNPAAPAVPLVSNLTYADGIVLTFSYPVAASTAPGTQLAFSLSAPLAANLAGSAVTVMSPTFTALVGVNPTCISAIETSIAAFLAAPTIAGLTHIQAELVAAGSTGICQ